MCFVWEVRSVKQGKRGRLGGQAGWLSPPRWASDSGSEFESGQALRAEEGTYDERRPAKLKLRTGRPSA